MCSFDSSMCHFTNNEDLRGEWVRMKATKDEVDHTSGTENGESLHDCRGHSIFLQSQIMIFFPVSSDLTFVDSRE